MASRHLTSIPLILLLAVAVLQGCGTASKRYVLVEESLRAGDTTRADLIIEQAEQEYDSNSRVLYQLDRGMTLHLSGRYKESNAILEQAEQSVEELYTRRLRAEAKALLVNDTELPYAGAPYEQVMMNVLKAINYALLEDWDESLVEARRIDHRLNVLSDSVEDSEAYRDDAFARYLTGVLYEAAGDLNNAFIAYRKAYDLYRETRGWSRTPIPPMLRADLLRITEGLHLNEEHEQYRRAFPDVSWLPMAEARRLAQIVVISYNGRAPHKEDQFIDLPISLDALKLVLLTKGAVSSNSRQGRAAESLLYGLSGRVVRVALPRLVRQKTQVAYGQVSLEGNGTSASARTELVQDLTTIAAKNLSDRYTSLAIKAVARAALKFALAEGVGRGAEAAAGKDAGPTVGLVAGILAKIFAIATEESDKRSWRTLPDEVQIARLWVPAGTYELRVRALTHGGKAVGEESVRTVTLRSGATKFFTERVL